MVSRRSLRHLLGLSLLLSSAPAAAAPEWDAVDHRASIAAVTGAVPAVATGLASLGPALYLAARPGPLSRDQDDLATAAVSVAPWGLVGAGLLAGGGLRAQQALAAQGAVAPTWPGWTSAGLAGFAVGSAALAAGAPSPADRVWLVTASAAFLAAAGAGITQLSLNSKARDALHPGGLPTDWQLDRGLRLYRTGGVALVGGGVAGLLVLPLGGALEDRPSPYASAVTMAAGGCCSRR